MVNPCLTLPMLMTTQVLREGDRGDEVKHLQVLLNMRGVPSPHLVADAAFGPKTKAAVIAFQNAHRLAPDGVVGPKTWAALAGTPGKSAPPPVAAAGETWQEIVRYLDRKRVRHWSPQHNQTTGGGHAKHSFHYRGTAVDLDPSAVIFKALEPLAQAGPARILAELFLDAPGCGFYKHGVRIGFVANHKSHLHVALEVGKHMPPG